MTDRFGLVPAGVLTALRGDTAALALYTALATHADRARECRPYQATLAATLGVSVRTVVRGVARLRTAGVVTTRPLMLDGRKQGTIYTLTGSDTTDPPEVTPPADLRARVRSSREEQLEMNRNQPPVPEPPDLALVAPTVLVDVPSIVDQVFAEWQRATGRTGRVILTAARRKKIAARLEDGYRVDDLLDAVRGVMLSEWHVENHYTDLVTVLRDADQVEKFRDLQRAPRRLRPAGRAQSGEGLQSMINERFFRGGAR